MKKWRDPTRLATITREQRTAHRYAHTMEEQELAKLLSQLQELLPDVPMSADKDHWGRVLKNTDLGIAVRFDYDRADTYSGRSGKVRGLRLTADAPDGWRLGIRKSVTRNYAYDFEKEEPKSIDKISKAIMDYAKEVREKRARKAEDAERADLLCAGLTEKLKTAGLKGCRNGRFSYEVESGPELELTRAGTATGTVTLLVTPKNVVRFVELWKVAKELEG